jgi:hypothetical protein
MQLFLNLMVAWVFLNLMVAWSTYVVARNHLGTCLVACRQRVKGVPSPEFAEGLALKHAVSTAIDEGFDKVIFASDCLSLLQRRNRSTMDRSDVGILVDGIKLRMTFLWSR